MLKDRSLRIHRRAFVFGVLGCLAVGFASPAHAEGPLVWNTDYAKAHKVRISENRPMIVFVSMDGCHFCDRMLQTTYSDQRVANQLSEEFVPTYVDGQKQRQLAKQFGVRVFPTTFVIASDNRVLDKIEGYLPADAFRQRISVASRREAKVRTSADEAR